MTCLVNADNVNIEKGFRAIWEVEALIDSKKYEEKAEKLKALAHPHRLCIIKGLIDNKCNVTRIQECLNLPQSTVSQHLAKLKSAGIIMGERKGLEICYSVSDTEVINIVKMIFHDGC